MVIVGIVVASIVGFLVLLVAISLAARGVLSAIAGPLAARVAANVPEAEIVRTDLRANTFGLTSKGVLQARGHGALVLTRSALRFFQLVPATELAIPLTDVRAVSLVRSHLGKSVGRKLLKVEFTAGGATDSVAWFIPEAESWRDALEQARVARA